MDDYVSKPVKQEALRAILARWTLAVDKSSEPAGADPARVLDSEVLAELRRLETPSGTELLSTVIDLYIADTPQRLAAIRAAMEQSNAKVVASEAHALKGSSLHLGAKRMGELCEILEEQARAGTTGGASVLLPVLEEEFARVREALKDERQTARVTTP
jgi:HPt (histidine-containing phosphotransfer) domain-containing protein